MLTRRSFVAGLTTLAISSKLRATQSCGVLFNGVPACRAEVDLSKVLLSITRQQCAEWCWAASIAMIFRLYGHPIDQKQIVLQTFGDVVCLPAGVTRTITSALSKKYRDATGRFFTSNVVAAYDAENGINDITNTFIVNELRDNHPLLYCNRSHAMVLCAVDFIPTMLGPDIRAGGVADPWPFSPALHNLSVPELIAANASPLGQMTYLASVRVEDADPD
ncbi:MAG TPA: papain-like cysteine protease family protein [Candidatus Acidoferrales bacterium]|nr:papain-like cysteine protease family protein [Candidatus Acidoferrales bacterium]